MNINTNGAENSQFLADNFNRFLTQTILEGKTDADDALLCNEEFLETGESFSDFAIYSSLFTPANS